MARHITKPRTTYYIKSSTTTNKTTTSSNTSSSSNISNTNYNDILAKLNNYALKTDLNNYTKNSALSDYVKNSVLSDYVKSSDLVNNSGNVNDAALAALIQKLKDYDIFKYDTDNKQVIVTEFFPHLGIPGTTYFDAEFQYEISVTAETQLALAQQNTGNPALNIFDFIHIGNANGPIVNESKYKNYFYLDRNNKTIKISASILNEAIVTTSGSTKSIILYIDDTELSTVAGFRAIQPNDAAWLFVDSSQYKTLIYPNCIVTDVNGNVLGYFRSTIDNNIGEIYAVDGTTVIVTNINLNTLQVTSLAQINDNSISITNTPVLSTTDPILEHPWVSGSFEVKFMPAITETKNGITCEFNGNSGGTGNYIYDGIIILTLPENVTLINNKSNGSWPITLNGNVIKIKLVSDDGNTYYGAFKKQIIIADSATKRYVIKLNGEPTALPPNY